MAVVIGKSNLLFGMPPDGPRTPIELSDEDMLKVRVRYRNDEFAQCWIKTTMGIRHFYLGWKEGAENVLEPIMEMEQGANYRK